MNPQATQNNYRFFYIKFQKSLSKKKLWWLYSGFTAFSYTRFSKPTCEITFGICDEHYGEGKHCEVTCTTQVYEEIQCRVSGPH